ncbi:MAG: hypothetical protein IKN54_04210 [Lachnospiraceae bacterium]|nr:hypothetical protein [Lachnospiraceae bacterium]
MTISAIRKCMLLSVLGVLLLATNIYVPSRINYPHSYKNESNVIGEYQYYNIKAFFGGTCTYKELDASGRVIRENIPAQGIDTTAKFVDQVFFGQIRIDLFSDYLGLALILISCLWLSRYCKAFGFTAFFASLSSVLKCALGLLPFFFNGIILCNMALGVGISFLIASIITTFFLFKGYIVMIPDASCRDERLWLNTGWFISFVLMILVLFLRWLDLSALMTIFNGFLIIDVLFLGYFLKRVDIFVLKYCQKKDQTNIPKSVDTNETDN